MAHFTLPDNTNLPSERFQLLLMPQVPLPITLELRSPEIQARLWHPGQFAVDIWVPVPEAAVDEDHSSAAAKHDVWDPGQPPIVEPVSIAHGMYEAADHHLWLCVAPANPPHSRTAIGGAKRIHTTV